MYLMRSMARPTLWHGQLPQKCALFEPLFRSGAKAAAIPWRMRPDNCGLSAVVAKVADGCGGALVGLVSHGRGRRLLGAPSFSLALVPGV
jgi:hypothetical protein